MSKWCLTLIVLVAITFSLSLPGCAKTKIVVAWWKSDEPWVYEMWEAFEKEHPDIDIEYWVTSFGEYLDKLVTCIAAGNRPDVAWINYGWVSAFYEYDIAVDHRSLIERDPDFNPQDYFSIGFDLGTMNGKLLGLPYFMSLAIHTAINRQVFNECGLIIPGPDWTWQEAMIVAKKIGRDTDGDGQFDQFGWSGGGPTHWMGAAGVPLYDKTGSKLNTPEVRRAIEFAVDFLSRPYVTTRDWEYWEQGKLGCMATFIQGVLHWVKVDWSVPKTALGNLPFPHDPQASNRQIEVIWDGWAVTSHEKQSAAWQLVKWLIGPEGLAKFKFNRMGTLQGLPFNKTEALQYIVNPEVAPNINIDYILNELTRYGAVIYRAPQHHEIIDALNKEWGKVLSGEESPGEMISKLHPVINNILAEK